MGASDSTGPTGRAEVLRWYESLKAAGRNRPDYVLHRVVVDQPTVVTEGDFLYAIDGVDLHGVERAGNGDQVEAGTYYLVCHRTLVLCPVNRDGLIEGEHIYAGERHRVLRPLAPGERPDLGPTDRAQGAT